MPLRAAATARRYAGPAAFLALVLLFLAANRGAYGSYFQDDELNNIAWTRAVPLQDFLVSLAAPTYFENNFRPAGHLFFHLMERAAGLDFPPYVRAIHVLHLLNVWLLWLVLRRFDFSWRAAGAGALFFAFHMALFDAYWKPMYVFDVLCATFCLLSLLLYQHGRWVLSLLAFWLAYKSKEPAIMLPVVLAAYEYWFGKDAGKRRWLPLALFFGVSLCFGLQALLHRHAGGHPYALSFSPFDLAATISFYARHVLLIPYAAGLLLALPLILTDRRSDFGLVGFAVLLGPMLLLPGRLFSAYLYLPLALLAIAVAAVAARVRPPVLAACFALWLPYNYSCLKEKRHIALTIAHENRSYTKALLDGLAPLKDTRVFVYDGAPEAMNVWGIEGILQYHYKERVSLYEINEPGLAEKIGGTELALLAWYPVTQKLSVLPRQSGKHQASFFRMGGEASVWQLVDGWHGRSGYFRWTRPTAKATLYRPEGARQFEVVVNMGPDYMKLVHRVSLETAIDGRVIGHREFAESGWHAVRWDLPPAPPGDVTVTFRVTPPCCPGDDDPKTLGIPIGAFGFRMGDEPLDEAIPAALREQ